MKGTNDINNCPKKILFGVNGPFWGQKMAHNSGSSVRIFLNFAQWKEAIDRWK